MNKDLGVWTNQDCALVLIDYQRRIFATIRSETSAAFGGSSDVRLLAKDRQGVQHADRAVHSCVTAGFNGADPAGDPRRAAWPESDRPYDDERVSRMAPSVKP